MALCKDRFLVQTLKDALLDKRVQCAKQKGHVKDGDPVHLNSARDLTWDDGMQIDLRPTVRR